MASLRDLERDLRRAKAAANAARDRALRETAHDVVKHLQFFSSGPLSSARLAREDHPYATRHPFPRYDPSIINKQTGVFKRSWVISTINVTGHQIYVVRNIASYAEYLEHGTWKMIARPIDGPARIYAARVLERKLELYIVPALTRTLSG